MSHYEMNRQFASALGLPKGCKRAVLTLEAGKWPRLDVVVFLRDDEGHYVIDRDLEEIRCIDFSYRLVRFGEP